MQNIYGSGGTGAPLALVLVSALPVYNVAAVLLLTLMAPGGHLGRHTFKKAFRSIVTNPIILGVTSGLLWSLLELPQPVIFQRAVSSLEATATPLGRGLLETDIDSQYDQAGASASSVFASGRVAGIPGGISGGDPGDAGFTGHCQLLQHGPQHGP